MSEGRICISSVSKCRRKRQYGKEKREANMGWKARVGGGDEIYRGEKAKWEKMKREE